MNVLVLMSGGFHPFHPGHLALYNSAKKAFPGADVVVGATNSQEKRPFSFKDKATLAAIAGVDKGHFVEVNRQFSVKGEPNIENRIQNPDDTILIFVRSVKDINDPVLQPWKPNPDGSVPMTKGSKNHPPRPTSDYLLSYKGNEKQLQPMTKHAYIAFLPVEEFSGNMTSATQIRDTWPTLDDQGKQEFATSLYPATQQNSKLLKTVVNILNRNIGSTSVSPAAPQPSAIDQSKAKKLKEQIQLMRPLIKEATVDQKKKFMELVQTAINESRLMDRTAKINAYYVSDTGSRHKVAENIPYYLLDKLVPLLTKKYAITMNDIEVRPVNQNQYRDTEKPEMADEGVMGFGSKKPTAAKKPLNYDEIRQMARDSNTQQKVFRSKEEFAKSKQPAMDEGAEEALQYATQAHAGQTRSGGDPYISHPVRVANHIKQYKQSHNLDALISAAYLHDTIEDTDTTQEILHDLFGGLVASLVQELTSDPEQIKKMGKAQYLAHKMAAMSSYALVIKLADRLDNVKDITTAKTPEWRAKYAKETNHILDYIEKTRALSGTHNKLISLIRAKLAEIDNPQQVADEGITRRGILKGLGAAMAAGAADKASAIAGAFPSTSTREKWAKDSAESNKAEAKRQAEKKRQELEKNTQEVDKAQRVNHHSLAPTTEDYLDEK